MTKRTNKPKVTSTAAAPTINSTPPKQAVEGDKVESNTVATPKPKRANSKAPSNPRGRPKKTVTQRPIPPEEVYFGDDGTVTIVNRSEEHKIVSEVTYVAPNRAIMVSEPPPSLYRRFVGWLIQKLFAVTYMFRGY